MDWLSDTRTSYDTVAGSYADLLRDSIDSQPVVRHFLALFAELTGDGPVVDVGCGTGRITKYLHDLGLDIAGVDLSPGMLELARRDYPELTFSQGNMAELDLEGLAGVIAWFSIIHVPDDDVRAAFGRFHRALRPGGVLALGFFAGDETVLKTEGYGGHPMRVYVHRRPVERVAGWLEEAGFEVEVRLHHRASPTVAGGMVIARGGSPGPVAGSRSVY